MKIRYALPIALMIVMLTSALAIGDTQISKGPDYGPWWNPLGLAGTAVYADGFYAPGGDDQVAALGTWLEALGAGETAGLRMQIWGSHEANGGPDCNNVIASTDEFTSDVVGELVLVTMPVTSGEATLVEGEFYWFVSTAVGGNPNAVAYRVGGHTQNSVYNDNATFWYANDPEGCTFDGQGLTPEMAFEVLLTGPVGTEQATWTQMKSLYK